MVFESEESVESTAKTGAVGFGAAFTAAGDRAASQYLKQQSNFSQNASLAMGYEAILNDGIWLEDKGQYARYAIGNEESVWVCHDCECADVDPYEEDCQCNDIEGLGWAG